MKMKLIVITGKKIAEIVYEWRSGQYGLDYYTHKFFDIEEALCRERHGTLSQCAVEWRFTSENFASIKLTKEDKNVCDLGSENYFPNSFLNRSLFLNLQ